MHDNAYTIAKFYDAFGQRDHETMASCYTTDVAFTDPVFSGLVGDEVRAMWHMLCEQGTDLEVSVRDIRATAAEGGAIWEADYTFTPSGRSVHNVIEARFGFEGGLIATHVDNFDLWKWMRMALGPIGSATGWTPFGQRKVIDAGSQQLDRFMAAHPEYER